MCAVRVSILTSVYSGAVVESLPSSRMSRKKLFYKIKKQKNSCLKGIIN